MKNTLDLQRHCNRCNHVWVMRTVRNPISCPRCKSPYWNRLRQKLSACMKCGSTWNLSVDHIVPRSKGGTNHPFNLQVLCRSCNSKKSTKVQNYLIKKGLG